MTFRFYRTFIKGCILMIVIISTSGEQSPRPDSVVKDIFAFVGPELRPYVSSQFQLEEIGDGAGLYDLIEEERIIERRKLEKDPEVRDLIKHCKKYHTQTNCNTSIYRTYDGKCNNVKHPLWGSSNYMMERYLPAAYEGIRGYRKAAAGESLPHPRNISLNLIAKDNPTANVSAFFTYFGQFVSHDISLAPSFIKFEEDPCDSASSEKYKFCENVVVRKDDPFYEQFNVKNLGFKRTAPYPKCNFDRRSPMNQETSLLDASHIYGYNESVANNVRIKDGSGKLMSQETSHGQLLPPNHIQDLVFCPRMKTNTCFTAGPFMSVGTIVIGFLKLSLAVKYWRRNKGDERVNQHVLLTTLHTVFMRFHNVIADKLLAMHPNWDEEKMYQETRRIVNVVYQWIIYKEYLPLLVGKNLMKDLNLSVDENSFYNAEINPGALAEFTTGSFRLHSMIPKSFSKNHPDKRFDDIYFSPSLIHDGETESLLKGSCEVPSEKNDRFLVRDITNYLYRPPGTDFGIDLTVLDIERERDHGIAGYVNVVQECSKGRINIREFSDLNLIMPEKNTKLLQRIYKNVSDIDLIIGIFMENADKDSVTGSTAACISAEQFRRLKFGDSFFFTHTNSRNPFTKEQLKSIRSFSLSQFICQAGGFTSIRRYPLLMPSDDNPIVDCQSVSSLDLEPWKDSSATSE